MPDKFSTEVLNELWREMLEKSKGIVNEIADQTFQEILEKNHKKNLVNFRNNQQ